MFQRQTAVARSVFRLVILYYPGYLFYIIQVTYFILSRLLILYYYPGYLFYIIQVTYYLLSRLLN